MPQWLADPMFVNVPLFVSRRTLCERVSLPVASTDWAMDSGGFTELQMYGGWSITAKQYVREVRRYVSEIGRVEWISPQDWMCEPIVIAGGTVRTRNGLIKFAGTKLSVRRHQELTIENYLELRSLAPELPFAAVLQGWEKRDYLEHVRMYEKAGVDLWKLPTVGIGSVCRRQATTEAAEIVYSIVSQGIDNAHTYGFKADGIVAVNGIVKSGDSLWWSEKGRNQRGCLPGHDKPGRGRKKATRTARTVDFTL